MKRKATLIIASLFCVSALVFGQEEMTIDSTIEAEFDNYLEHIFALPNDTVIELDTTKQYRVRYTTSYSINFQFEMYDSCYADSFRTICIVNPQNSDDTISLNAEGAAFETKYHSKLRNEPRQGIACFIYKPLIPLNVAKYQFLYGEFERAYSCVTSFNQGKELTVTNTATAPDIRSSMPPTFYKTYFLELIEE